jgi:hypothetical protein
VSADLTNPDAIMVKVDITSIQFEDQSFDSHFV